MQLNGLLNDGPYKTATIYDETLSLDEMLSSNHNGKDSGDAETPLDDESRAYINNIIRDLMELNSQIRGRSTHEKAIFNPIFRDAKRLAEQPTQRMKLNDKLHKSLSEHVDEGLREGIYRILDDHERGPSLRMIPIVKPNGEIRWCIDARLCNQYLEPESYDEQAMDEMLDDIKSSNCKIFSKLDIKSAFLSVPWHQDPNCAPHFIHEGRRIGHLSCAFGYASSSAAWGNLCKAVLMGIPNVKAYVDDIIIFSNDLDSHAKTLREVIKRINDANLRL